MPNIAAALKQEIARVARKETKGELEELRRSAVSHKKQLTQMKRRVDALERLVKSATKSVMRSAPADEHVDGRSALRFRPDGLAKHRARLGLSANEVAKILGVSALSVYKWESGKTRPRAKQLETLAQLRTMGKREAAKRLEESGAS